MEFSCKLALFRVVWRINGERLTEIPEFSSEDSLAYQTDKTQI